MAGMPWQQVEQGWTPGGELGDDVAGALARLLAVEPDERAALRLVGALADALPPVSCAALVLEGEGGRLEIVAGVGLDEPSSAGESGLVADALHGGTILLAPDPGPPFPAGTRVGAAAPIAAGETRGAFLVGTREGSLAPGALLVLRAAADRAGLLTERERLLRAGREATERARRVGDELERRRHAVDTILGVVGHDLRNPLGAIHMSAALLQKRGGLEGWQARTVERMRSSAGRMGRIIADLLSYTRTRLEQVASNLVANAVDHGDPDTPVLVVLEGDEQTVSLMVRNSGPGLPPEVLAHLFEPFSRPPDEHSRKASGLGLGLFISREIVRGHGGEISATTEGGETVVRVRLPRGR
jgi:signal transduction histidine kinase